MGEALETLMHNKEWLLAMANKALSDEKEKS